MSRIGKLPIKIPEKVKVAVLATEVSVQGPLGRLTVPFHPTMSVVLEAGAVLVHRPDDSRVARSLHGLTRTLIANAVKGVTTGFQEVLEINGVGYKAEAKGQTLHLALGFSHPVAFEIPQGIGCEVEKQTRVILKGTDKHLLGMTAARIRAIRKTEPYKGKGIRYAGEKVRRKVGKQGAA